MPTGVGHSSGHMVSSYRGIWDMHYLCSTVESNPSFKHVAISLTLAFEHPIVHSRFTLYSNFMINVIRHVFGFGIEFLEQTDICIFGHFIVIDFIQQYSYHTYLSPISTFWFRRFGTECIVRNGEWHIFVNYYVFSALIPLKLRVIFEESMLATLVQKYTVPPIFISNYHRWKPNSTTTYLCIGLSLFTSH